MLITERRNYGIDILRCLSMFFVVFQHILGQGGILQYAEATPGKYFFLSFFHILSYCSVDIFGITTGYLMCRKEFRLSRAVNVWLTTVFWSVAVSCIFFVFMPEKRTVSEMVSMFFPILRGRYWFLTAYIVVILLSPILNLVIHTLSRRQFHLMFAAFFVIFGIIPIGSLGYDVMRISGGNHFSWMIVLYLIGGYLRMYVPSEASFKKPLLRNWLAGYFFFATVHLLYKLAVTLLGISQYKDLMLTCVSPLIVAESICLFLYFQNAGTHLPETGNSGHLIRFITPGVYSVYAISVHPLVFWESSFISLLRPWDHWNGITILLASCAASLSVFVFCILLDALRRKLFTMLRIDDSVHRVSNWAEHKIRSLLT